MSQIEFYFYAGCSSCASARSLLRELGDVPMARDLFKDRMTASEIKALLARVNLNPSSVLSKRSRPYAALGLAARNLTDAEIITLMSEYPALIRRPVIVRNGSAVVGFDRAAIMALIAE